jgi:HK97 family phage major capsid protein
MPRETVDLAELNTLIEDIGRTTKTYQDENDKRLEALGAGDESSAAEIKTKLDKMDGHLTKLTKLKSEIEVKFKNQQERIEELESRQNQPGATVVQKLETERKAAFMKWVRSGGRDFAAEATLQDLEGKILKEHSERKDITIGTGSAGGVAVPQEISREVERQERLFSPVRELVKVVTVGTSDYKELVNERGTTGGWVGETAARAATNTPTFRERTPTHGELYAYPQVSNWSLEDIFFPVDAFLTEEIAETFAIEEGSAVISGNGVTKPTGMLNTAPVSTADTFPPTRNVNAFQSIESVDSPQSTLSNPDTLLDVVYALNSRYRSAAVWIMNSVTTGVVRKLKDAQGQYLWAPGLQAGQPDRLLGYPTSTWEQMSDPNDGAFPIGFGNWRRAYVLVDRLSGLRITRDEVTNPGYTRFYVRRREGGIVLNNNAAKFLKV